MFSKENFIVLGIILINFSLQSLNPLSFAFQNYYEWDGVTALFPDFFANKLFRLSLNLAGLNLIISYKKANRNILISFFLILGILFGIYLSSYIWLIPIEISKLLNPILFSPLLIIGSFAFKIAGNQNLKNDS